MQSPPYPPNEQQRLATLLALRILDTPPEERFDRITRTAQRLFDVPIALVSLVDANRQWFKSCYGLPVSETPRDVSFCGHAILSEELFVIENATQDTRFADNPLVTGGPEIRFYAGCPLRGPDGVMLGTLCVISPAARRFTDADRQALRDLGAWAENELSNMAVVELGRAQQELSASEERLKLVLEGSNDGFYDWNVASGAVDHSRRFAEMLGYVPEELAPHVSLWERLIHPEDKPAVIERLKTHLEGHSAAFIAEYRLRTKSNAWQWVLDRGKVVARDAQGKALRMTGTHTDISARKRAEQTLLDTLVLQRAILDSANLTIISTNTQGVIQTFNAGAQRMLGYTGDEVVGKLTPAIIHDPDEVVRRAQVLSQELGETIAPGFEVFVAKAARSGVPDENEWTYIRKDGSRFPVLLSITGLRDVGGIINGYLGVGHDLTERKQAERARATTLDALRESEGRVRAVLDNVLEGIVTISTQGIVESFNAAAENIFGYAAVEVIGRNVNMLMPENYSREHDQYLRNYLTTGRAKVIGIGREVTGRRKDGTEFPMELAVSEIPLGDTRIFTGIVRDITERKQLERMKHEFISTVSHELRTPLTSIRGSLGLIAGGAVGAVPAQAKALIDIACNNSDRLVRLINDILDVEKIESGKMTFRIEPVDLVALLNEAIAANSAYAAQHAVTFALVEQVQDARVAADPDRLTQVVTNLLSNAVKFSPPDGRVDVGMRRLKDAIRVRVTDYGPGIPEEFQSRIFQKFAQADASDTRQKGGTGLGLSISKAIIERLGGSIGFTTGADGTTFYFDLRTDARPDTAAAAELIERQQQPTILICEDDPDVAHLLSLMLAQGGYASDIAYDAAQAKQRLRERVYVAMTLDIMLPGQDGIALIRELRLDPALRQLPIVVVSAKSEEGRMALSGDALAVVDWLSKPIDTPRLLAAVALAAQRNGSVRARILYVEDDADIVRVVTTLLQDKADLLCAGSLAAARRILAEHGGEIDLVILDIGLPDGSGLDLLPELHRPDGTPLQVIVFSAHEVSGEISKRVALSLVKSRASNQALLDGILALLGKPAPVAE